MAKKSTGAKASKATEKARRAALTEIGARLEPKAKGAKGGQRGAAKAPKEAKPKRAGALDAAVRVLEGAGEPMTCGAIVEKALERKLWETKGKTPSATLYAAIIREVADKGREARFVKTGRGLFTLRGVGKGG